MNGDLTGDDRRVQKALCRVSGRLKYKRLKREEPVLCGKRWDAGGQRLLSGAVAD
jgi:hypothetical protein